MTDLWDGPDGPIPLPVEVDAIPLVCEVMGLADVARGMPTMAPCTVYLRRGEDRSGVVGILFPSGDFLPKVRSTTGQRFEVEDELQDCYVCEVRWDGAQPSPVSDIPIGYEDEAQFIPIFQEHSKGVMLGDYPTTGELWNAIRYGGRMSGRQMGRLHASRDSDPQGGENSNDDVQNNVVEGRDE